MMLAPRRTAAAVLVALLAVALTPALSAGAVKPRHVNPPQLATSLGLSVTAPVRQGGHSELFIHVTTARGPLARAVVHFSVSNGRTFALRTNSNGDAHYSFRRNTPAGTYSIQALYKGNKPKGAAPTSASATLTILPRSGTTLTISPLSPVSSGQEAKITVTLTSAGGGGLPHKPVHLTVAGTSTLLETGADGTATYRVSRATPAGSYPVTAEYKGSFPQGLAASADHANLVLTPIGLTVQTLPAVQGATVTVDGKSYTTDAEGKAVAPVPSTGTHVVAIAPPAPVAGAQVLFAQWSDGTTATQRSVHMLAGVTIYASFRVSILTRLNFVAADSSPITAAAVRNLVISAPDGTQKNLDGQTQVWLDLPAPPRDSTGAGAKHPTFSTLHAEVHGINVVTGGSNAFSPVPGGQWNITLGLYSVDVNVKHLLPLRGLAGTLHVETTGWSTDYTVGSDGHTVIHGLPRGHYTLTVIGGGLVSSVPVALSRSQPVTLQLVDRFDIALIVALALVMFAGLLLARPVYHRVRNRIARLAAERAG